MATFDVPAYSVAIDAFDFAVELEATFSLLEPVIASIEDDDGVLLAADLTGTNVLIGDDDQGPITNITFRMISTAGIDEQPMLIDVAIIERANVEDYLLVPIDRAQGTINPPFLLPGIYAAGPEFELPGISIGLNDENTPPVAGDDTAEVDEDEQLDVALADLLANDTDADEDMLRIVNVSAENGTASLDLLFEEIGEPNFLTYVPDANFNGTDTVTYIVSDGNGGTSEGTLTVTVGAVNDAPVAGDDDDFTTDEDTALSIPIADLLANDTDIDGDTLTIETVGEGLTVDGENLVFTPAADFNGSTTTTYTVTDGNGGSSTASVTIDVAAVNDAPEAVDDSGFSTPFGTQLFINEADLLANDNDGDPELDQDLSILFSTSGVGGFASVVDGLVVFTPDEGFTGAASFDYLVSDGNGGTDTATVTLSVGENTPPVAEDFGITVAEDGSVSVDILDNATDADGDDLDVTFGEAANGAVAFDGEEFRYTPNADFNGLDSFTYTVNDGNGGEATGTVDVTVDAVNDDPVGDQDFADVQAGESVTVDVLANDSDIDGDDLTIGAVAVPAEGVGTVAVVDNEIVFTAGAETQGDVTLGYQILDGNGGSTASQVTFTVTEQPNEPPVAVDDVVSTDEETAASINVLTGAGADSDLDGDDLVVTSLIFDDQVVAAGEIITSGPFAALSIAGDGTLSLTPAAALNSLAAGESEETSISYEISDGNGGTDQASVSITIYGINDAPDAVDDTGATTVGAAVTLDLLGDDTDPDASDILAIDALDTEGTQGTVTDNGDGSVSYDPNGAFDLAADESATDTFGYTVSDGNGGFDTATVTVTINGEMEEPDTFVLIRGTLGNDRLRGTDANERFELLGGEIDGVRGGGGNDVFAFADQDGVRDSLRVLDFNTSEDFLDLGDAVVSSTSATANGLTIRLEGEDRDYIYLAGVESFEDVNLFTGEPVDPELPLIEGQAGISDRITGTDEAERIDGLGGPIDAVRGGGGGDIFAFTDAEGIRDSLRILDYEIGVDSIDLGGAAIRSTSVTSSGTLIRVDNDDRDLIFVSNVFDEADITFVGDTTLV